MPTLRLGAYHLPAAEVVLVQTLFRLFAHGNAFRWTFVAAPPYDALLIDDAHSESNSPRVLGLARIVLRLTRMNAPDAPGTLQRPIRADRLRDLLDHTEQALMDTRPAADSRIEQLGSQAGQAEPAPSLGAPRFKLRRWPPTVLLRGDPARIRMASLLSRRALSTTELARISGRSNEESQAFLQLLQTTGLVNLHQEAPAPEVLVRGHIGKAPTHPRGFGRGLIAGIRRRLGMLTGGTHTP